LRSKGVAIADLEKEKVASIPDRMLDRTLDLTPAPLPVIRYKEGTTLLEDRTLAGLDRRVRSSVVVSAYREERE
jgi:hypothetical protein